MDIVCLFFFFALKMPIEDCWCPRLRSLRHFFFPFSFILLLAETKQFRIAGCLGQRPEGTTYQLVNPFRFQFPLPLRCAWVINNTQVTLAGKEQWHLHLYFTQVWSLPHVNFLYEANLAIFVLATLINWCLLLYTNHFIKVELLFVVLNLLKLPNLKFAKWSPY